MRRNAFRYLADAMGRRHFGIPRLAGHQHRKSDVDIDLSRWAKKRDDAARIILRRDALSAADILAAILTFMARRKKKSLMRHDDADFALRHDNILAAKLALDALKPCAVKSSDVNISTLARHATTTGCRHNILRHEIYRRWPMAMMPRPCRRRGIAYRAIWPAMAN